VFLFRILIRIRFLLWQHIRTLCSALTNVIMRKRLSTRYVFDCLTFNLDRIVLFNDKRYIMLRLFVFMVTMVTPRAYHIIIYIIFIVIMYVRGWLYRNFNTLESRNSVQFSICTHQQQCAWRKYEFVEHPVYHYIGRWRNRTAWYLCSLLWPYNIIYT